MIKHAWICLALGTVLALGACATGQSVDDTSKRYDVMVTRNTPLYMEGPDQTTPPNGELKRGTRVRVISRHGDKARVQSLGGGVTGYVSMYALGPINEGRQSWTEN